MLIFPAKRLPSTPTWLRNARLSPEKHFVPSTIRVTGQSKALSVITDDPFIDAITDYQSSFALPLFEQKSSQIKISQRIEFTGFSLVENLMARSPRNDEDWLALSAAFPGARGI